MKVTDPMVDRMCRVLAENDWLPEGWDAEGSAVCPTCNRHLSRDGDGGGQVRREVREFLEAAVNPRPHGSA